MPITFHDFLVSQRDRADDIGRLVTDLVEAGVVIRRGMTPARFVANVASTLPTARDRAAALAVGAEWEELHGAESIVGAVDDVAIDPAGPAEALVVAVVTAGPMRRLLAVCRRCGGASIHGGGVATAPPVLGNRVAHCACRPSTYELVLAHDVATLTAKEAAGALVDL